MFKSAFRLHRNTLRLLCKSGPHHVEKYAVAANAPTSRRCISSDSSSNTQEQKEPSESNGVYSALMDFPKEADVVIIGMCCAQI